VSACARAASLAVALLAGCVAPASSQVPKPSAAIGTDPEPRVSAFPEFPTTSAAIEDLVRRETRRPPKQSTPLSAESVRAAISERPNAIVAGDRAIVRWLQAFLDRAPRDAYLLVGNWHDAPGQIDAFRRLVGPAGVRGLDLVALEMFRAPSAWRGVPAALQQGDDAAIEAYVARGDRDAFLGLIRAHREADYVAWKLDYVPTVMDLLIQARATGVPLHGCDMPVALQEKAGVARGVSGLRLREIHCVKSLPAVPRGRPRRAALLWGDAHLAPDGIGRFLPADAAVLSVHLLGARLEAGAVETALAKYVAVADPVLVPLGDDEAALLLPDAALGARVDRAVTTPEAGSPFVPGVAVVATERGSLLVGGRSAIVGPEGATVAIPEGEHAWIFTNQDQRTIGSLRLDAGHRLELAFHGRDVVYVDRSSSPER
jgi:hypothetical protein